MCLFIFRQCREKWGAEQPCILLLAKKKGLAPTLCALKSCTNIPTKCREKRTCLLQRWKHLVACRTQNCVIFYTVGCWESKNVPPTQLPNLVSPLPGFACPVCASIPVAIKSQVSFTLIKSLRKCRREYLCFGCASRSFITAFVSIFYYSYRILELNSVPACTCLLQWGKLCWLGVS